MVLLSELTCPWPVGGCGLENVDPDDEIFVSAVATASSIMTRLSGYTVGTCEATLRPLSMCPECRSWCCGGADALLIKGPYSLKVWDITSVSLGATEYDEATWRFDRDTSTLYRVPPERWPSRDEKWSAPGSGSAFSIEATIGAPPDAWALDVAARLTKELYNSCTGVKCRLPTNTTSVTAQGITVRLRDLEINTFIPELAAWVNAVNPFGARLPATVFSPDLAAARRGGSGGCCGC